MRRYADIYVSKGVDPGLLRHLGWSAAAISVEDLKMAEQLPRGTVMDGLTLLRRFTSVGLRSGRQLIKARGLVEAVAVEPLSLEQARAVARNGLADLISLPAGRGCLNEGVASLMKSSGVFLELRLSPLIEAGCSSNLLAEYRRWYRLARGLGVGVIFSSGASSSLQARSPRDLSSLASLITLDGEEAREALSEAPWRLLERGLRRLSEGYVMPGIKVEDQG